MSQGLNQVGTKISDPEFVKHLLYFMESAAALDKCLYLLLKACLKRYHLIICI